MLKKEMSSGSGGNSSGGGWARVCDSCQSAACAVYCRADLAYLCAGCDARLHAANQLASRHERVWMCEACEQAPAAFTCKADAASLCTTCDADIHAANPLARRHQRVPVQPISGCVYGPSSNYRTRQLGFLADKDDSFLAPDIDEVEEEEDETSSWLLLNPVKTKYQSNGFLFGGEDEYLDFEEYNSCTESQYQEPYNHQQQQQNNFSVPQNQVKKNNGNDSVVPVQYGGIDQNHQQQNHQLDMEFENSKAGYHSYPASLSHSVSMSSMDASIVPDSTMSDISNMHSRTPKGTIDLFSSPPVQMPAQFSPLDREARVLRYREKRKTRKFEKTIRYASRKAYAETRPRIKGRFAKRTDKEVEVDQMFATSVMSDSGYGIVPSF
ncbi:Zinc finger protein CONSTANS-like [Ranunculus cassubicifolius]